jgi:hypothetical protein
MTTVYNALSLVTSGAVVGYVAVVVVERLWDNIRGRDH